MLICDLFIIFIIIINIVSSSSSIIVIIISFLLLLTLYKRVVILVRNIWSFFLFCFFLVGPYCLIWTGIFNFIGCKLKNNF